MGIIRTKKFPKMHAALERELGIPCREATDKEKLLTLLKKPTKKRYPWFR